MSRLVRRKGGFLPMQTGGFEVPASWRGGQVQLVAASPDWVDLDYAAVLESRPRIKHIFGTGDDWPPDHLEKADDRSDLIWHEREFLQRRSFAYHLLSHDRHQCLGCLYLYPTASRNHDAEAYLWTHIAMARSQANAVEAEIIDWVTHYWPFEAIAWPGRFIPFRDWEEAAIPNYYASYRMKPSSCGVGG